MAEPLFLSDAELIERFKVGERRGRAAILALVRQGFPPTDPLFGKRYFPAVKAFLDRRSGLDENQTGPLASDGRETWGDY